MTPSKNDRSFIRAMKAATDRTSPAGRPKGAKDKTRRKNPLHKWSVDDLRDKFMARILPSTQGCWIWAGATTRGFGYMVVGSRQDNAGKSPRMQAHRISYLLHLGELEKRDLVAQKCDNKLCVAPRHLYTWSR